MSAKQKLNVILGVLLIAFVVLITLKYLLKVPPFVKIAALAVNALTIYYAVNYLIKPKKKNNGRNEN